MKGTAGNREDLTKKNNPPNKKFNLGDNHQ